MSLNKVILFSHVHCFYYNMYCNWIVQIVKRSEQAIDRTLYKNYEDDDDDYDDDDEDDDDDDDDDDDISIPIFFFFFLFTQTFLIYNSQIVCFHL